VIARPELFPAPRVLADRVPLPTLLRQSSESLAGRIALIQMSGFSLGELGPDSHLRHWLRGGFPLSYLAEDDARSSPGRLLGVECKRVDAVPLDALIGGMTGLFPE